jgi:teichuronic acid biosynthesis glycosyltransferase TuaC
MTGAGAAGGGVERPAPYLSLHHLDRDANILVVTSGWPHSDEPAHSTQERYGVFLWRQIESLRRLGYRFDVLFIRGFASSLAYPRAAGLLLRWSLVGDRVYRLIHAHGGEAAIPSVLYRRAPLLVSYSGDDLLGTPTDDGAIPWRSRLRRSFIRQSAHFAAGTITKSREMESYLPRGQAERNVVIPNGVDTSIFAPRPRAEARAELGWGQERVALFAADPEVPRKRHRLALEACDLASQKLPDLRLHVANRVEPREMPTVMNAADCLLLTSSVEGSPNVVKEALMCNLPVIATQAGDVDELLASVEPSQVVADDPAQIAAALVACLRIPGRSNGRLVSGHLSAEVVAGRVGEVYERLLRSAGS